MDRRREAPAYRTLESLERRTMLSVVSVQNFGATPNDGSDDTSAIQRAINSSRDGDTILFPTGTFDLKSPLDALPGNRTYRGEDGATLRGRTGPGQMLNVRTDNITFVNLTFDGGGVFIEKAGGFNQNIVFENNVFKLNTSGEHNSAITFTAGLGNSRITNNLFTGYTGGFAVYGYNYNGLTIANNDIINITAGIHIHAFYNSGNLLAEQNFISGVRGMGMEFQGKANNLVFQDNWFEHPVLWPDAKRNTNAMAFSLILDLSSNVTIRRNGVVAPEKADGIGCRIGFEVGGDNVIVEDNYVNGIHHVLAMNDGVGTASVIARNNRFLNFKQGISSTFANSIRTLQSINNTPTTALTWDIDRTPGGRNRRLGETPPQQQPDPTPSETPDPTPTTPDPTTPPVDETPTDPTVPPVDETPTDPTVPPVDQTPTEPTVPPVDETPTDPTIPPIDQIPTDPAPTDPNPEPPVDETPTEPTPEPDPVIPDPGPVIGPVVTPKPPKYPVVPAIPTAPAAVTELSAVSTSSTRVVLSWQDNSYNEMGFRIERSYDGENWAQIAVVAPNTQLCSDMQVTPGRTYYYRVIAFNAVGNANYSNVAIATVIKSAKDNGSDQPDESGVPTVTDTSTRPRPIPVRPTIGGGTTFRTVFSGVSV